jgi:hypothetical protein
MVPFTEILSPRYAYCDARLICNNFNSPLQVSRLTLYAHFVGPFCLQTHILCLVFSLYLDLLN